jgi:hypothetical protein
MKLPLALTCLLLVRQLQALFLRSILSSTVEKNNLERELLLSVSEADTMINFNNEVLIKSGPYSLVDSLNILACAEGKNVAGTSLQQQIMRIFTMEDIDIDMKVISINNFFFLRNFY